MPEIKSVSSLTTQQLAESLPGNVTQQAQVTTESAPVLPAPAQTTEYYTGFTSEFQQLGVDLQNAVNRLDQAQTELNKPADIVSKTLGIKSFIINLLTGGGLSSMAADTLIEQGLTPEQKLSLKAEAASAFDAASTAVQTIEWKQVVMSTLPVYMSDPTYDIKTSDDVLKLIPPGVVLSDADTVWLNSTFSKLQPLTNTLPEGYEGDILDTQQNILNNVLTTPKLELRGVHSLTIDEIAKSFAFTTAELPAGMTADDVRSLLSSMDLQDEELTTQKQWLAEQAAAWETESARMSMIKAGTILASTPELTPLQWAKMILTQPMMATVELMQKWYDTISRPIAAALIMNLPAPAAGAALGAPGGAMTGALIGSIVPGIGTAIGAGIGALIGAIGGSAWFSLNTADEDKELTAKFDLYRSQGDSTWSSYAKAFNAWEAPWWKKMILDSAYDPLMYLGWGAMTAVGNKLATMALPRGLKVAGVRVGTLMSSFEQGYVSGMDAIFKVGVGAVSAPIKGAFWLTGGGYAIPKTLTQMGRNFARQGILDVGAVANRVVPQVDGKWVGLTFDDIVSTAKTCIRSALDDPLNAAKLNVKTGGELLEFSYLDNIAASKLMKGVVTEGATFDTAQLAKLNSRLCDAISGQIPATGEAMNRIVAGNILGDLGIEATEKQVANLAARIVKFKDTIAQNAIGAIKGETAQDAIKSLYTHLESTRYGNLHSELTQYMQQAGRSASWHSRSADRILYSARLVSLERRFVLPVAKWQLLFTNFGPWNAMENSGRSFLGGAEFMYPANYGGAAETNKLTAGLPNRLYELEMFEQGQTRLTQAIVDPATGKTAVFEGGKIPFVTRDVKIPDKIPFFGGKMVGKTVTIGGRKFFIGSAQDWYDLWGKITADQTAYDIQVHFLKALQNIDPTTMNAIADVIEVKTASMLDSISSISKSEARDIRRTLRLEAIGGGPNRIRPFADMTVTDMQLRKSAQNINQFMDNMNDIQSITKVSIGKETQSGQMFAKGTTSIDERMAAKLESEREMSIASLAPQIDALKQETEAFIANPPKNLQEFLGDMQSITSQMEGVSERIHDYRRLTELRKAKLNPASFDDFEVGSAKMLAEFMDTSEEQLTKMMNQLMENAKVSGLTDIQLARLTDLDSITRLKLQNMLATRNKLAEVESVIPKTPRRLRNDKFWASQKAQKSAIWDESDTVSRRLESMELSAKRNFLTSVDKPVYVPDFIPEVTGDLTANHLAYLYGVTGDDLYRGLTRVQTHITVRPKEDFILHTQDQANAYAAKFGKTADDLGFTKEAIGDVYDQMWRSLGIDPMILTPDSPTVMQLEEIRQELYKQYFANRIPESDVVKWKQYINAVADGVGETGAYKGVVAGAPEIIETGKPLTIRAYRGTKLKGEPPTDEGLVGKGQYWSTERAVAETYDAVRETTINLQNPYVIKTEAEFKDFSNMRIRPLRDTALAEGHDEDWVQAMLRSQLENEGYDGVIIEAGIVEKGRQIAVFNPEEALSAVTPTTKVPTGMSGTPEWWAAKESAMTKAREMHKLAYPTYDDANIIDESMRAIFPFWNYELFRWKWIPRTFMRTPGTLSALARYTTYTDSGYVPVPGTDLQVNPLRGTIFMGGLRSLYLKDFPEYHDAAPGVEFLDYIGRAGFFPGIHVMLPIILFGAAGKQPQLGELAPAWMKTGLSALRALSPQHIGAVLDIVYPDRFRDYMTMMTLGSWGYDADTIWKKKQQGEKLTDDEEKLWLKAEANVDGIKGVLMGQTGLFRIRPQDFIQMRKEMQLAIEDATGVPVATQNWIDKMYPVTGKRFTDYYPLDIQQQQLLYQWESYRRYQGITTPLYPSSWQALDIKISDYYDELARIYTDARYNGVYDSSGNLVQPSIVELNKELIAGSIGPGQWVSARNNILDALSAKADELGNSPAYKDVPKTFDERAQMLAERGVVTPTKSPDQELLYYYYELKPELKYDAESDTYQYDYDTYYAYVDALLDSLSPTFRQRLLDVIQHNWTPMERLYWQFSKTYGRPYRNIQSIVLSGYTAEEQKLIQRYSAARGDERTQLQATVASDGTSLISGYQSKIREARMRLRQVDPELDAWLYFFGTTDKFMSNQAEEAYNQLKTQYLVPSMAGEAK